MSHIQYYSSIRLAIFSILISLHLSAFGQNLGLLEKKVSLGQGKYSLEQSIENIENQTSAKISYNAELINLRQKLFLPDTLITIKSILDLYFSGSAINYSTVGNQIVLHKAPPLQNRKIQQQKAPRNALGTDTCVIICDTIHTTDTLVRVDSFIRIEIDTLYVEKRKLFRPTPSGRYIMPKLYIETGAGLLFQNNRTVNFGTSTVNEHNGPIANYGLQIGLERKNIGASIGIYLGGQRSSQTVTHYYYSSDSVLADEQLAQMEEIGEYYRLVEKISESGERYYDSVLVELYQLGPDEHALARQGRDSALQKTNVDQYSQKVYLPLQFYFTEDFSKSLSAYIASGVEFELSRASRTTAYVYDFEGNLIIAQQKVKDISNMHWLFSAGITLQTFKYQSVCLSVLAKKSIYHSKQYMPQSGKTPFCYGFRFGWRVQL